MPALRILLSVCACEPHRDSGPGIGWHWAIELARAGHEVWLLTRANNRTVIENTVATLALPNLQVMYYDLPAWARWMPGGYGVRPYCLLWRWGAHRAVRQLCREIHFDVVHHLGGPGADAALRRCAISGSGRGC